MFEMLEDDLPKGTIKRIGFFLLMPPSFLLFALSKGKIDFTDSTPPAPLGLFILLVVWLIYWWN
jgi:hypothetical protein